MADPNVLERMRDDWNQRAREDANYYVAFGRREQDEDEFFETAAEAVHALEVDLPRLRGRDAALEIGCGPGRLIRPMSRYFGEIHGIDVSDEMIRLARERLRDLPHTHVETAGGSDLAMFRDEMFDFVYSFAVFQHIPTRDVVFGYLAEASRVLKPGGILRCQLNGLPQEARRYTTWDGVRISAGEVADFAREHDFQLLSVTGDLTQYMWITCRKQPDGGSRGLSPSPDEERRVAKVTNAHTGETVAPASGPLAAISVWIRGMPADGDLNNLEVRADGRPCRLSYLGEPEPSGLSQLNAVLPQGLRTGLVPVEVDWVGRPLCPTAWVRLIPPAPMIPRLGAVTDGINLLSKFRTEGGALKVIAEEVRHPDTFGATVDGQPVRDSEFFCIDPVTERYEFNFRMPEHVAAGFHELRMTLGRRVLGAMTIEVA